jgi:glycosyltransferase involved in cell wall biosynthesis
MSRPNMDVVVPFAGSLATLTNLCARMSRLRLRAGDSLTIVDNRPPAADPLPTNGTTVLRAPERQSSYFARNRGVAGKTGAWILFIDADVDPPPDLLDRYFEEAPAEDTAVLTGGVEDEPLSPGEKHSIAARYTRLRRPMSQRSTLRPGKWGYAQTANCAVRRSAFEAIAGFCDDIRSGGDADLCFRLKAAGWGIESREAASVIHRSRRTVAAMLRQRVRHGSGVAWLNRRYPGAFPRTGLLWLTAWTARRMASGVVHAARRRGDDALLALMEPISIWAFEFGRLFPNKVHEAPAQRRR